MPGKRFLSLASFLGLFAMSLTANAQYDPRCNCSFIGGDKMENQACNATINLTPINRSGSSFTDYLVEAKVNTKQCSIVYYNIYPDNETQKAFGDDNYDNGQINVVDGSHSDVLSGASYKSIPDIKIRDCVVCQDKLFSKKDESETEKKEETSGFSFSSNQKKQENINISNITSVGNIQRNNLEVPIQNSSPEALAAMEDFQRYLESNNLLRNGVVKASPNQGGISFTDILGSVVFGATVGARIESGESFGTIAQDISKFIDGDIGGANLGSAQALSGQTNGYTGNYSAGGTCSHADQQRIADQIKRRANSLSGDDVCGSSKKHAEIMEYTITLFKQNGCANTSNGRLQLSEYEKSLEQSRKAVRSSCIGY